MASITSLSNSSYNTSSIYGNRNVLSGLASGMDTESMIENAVSGIKLKIQNLTKKRTKIEWQQEAYRSIIDKAVNLGTKYTSYSSKTNLLSNSFFNNAVTTQTLGTYKDKISASGKSSSEIKINAVKQMATAATYTVSGGDIASTGKISGQSVDLGKDIKVSNLTGTMTLKYGGTNGTSFDISFDELEDLDDVKGVSASATKEQKLAKAIENKLSELTYNYTKGGLGESTTADKAIKVNVGSDGKITFSDGLGNGNSISIGSVTGDLAKTLGVKSGDKEIGKISSELSHDVKTYDYISGKDLKFSLNGVTKKITLGNYDGNTKAENVVNDIQNRLDEAYGKGKVIVGNKGSGDELALTFDVKEQGSTLSVSGGAAKALELGEDGAANYADVGKKLSDIFSSKADSLFSDANRLKGEGRVTGKLVNGEMRYTDEKGNRVDKSGNRIDSDGKALYDFKVNGVSIAVSKDTTLDSLMNSINSNADAGVKVSYSKMTNEFKFTAAETGANSRIEFGEGMAKEMFNPNRDDVDLSDNLSKNYGLNLRGTQTKNLTLKFDNFELKFNVDKNTTMQQFADEISNGSGKYLTASYNEKTGQLTVTDPNGNEQEFSITDQYGFSYKRETELAVTGKYTAGKDAVMDVEVNGTRFENLTRSSNSFDIDGMTINVKGTFEAVGKDGEEYEPVTFNTTTDSDKIIDAIRSFIDDYNEMATEIKNAYSTLPAEKSNKSRYEPLTAEEEEGYSESELKAYNEKAKQGILFGDSNLSRMYSQLLSAISPSGKDGQTLREIGIDTSYSNGMTTLTLDEDKLRSALETNPDKVRDAFTKSRETGSSSNGLMTNLQKTLDTYVKTTGEPKGVLIQHAGSAKAYTSLNNNSLKSQIDNIDNQIERWQDKMSNQIDRYTTQFSKLEQLIAQMNSQSSALSGLMGGGSGY